MTDIQLSVIDKANALLDQLVTLHEELKEVRKEVNILEGSTRQLFVEAVELYKSTGMGDFEVSELVRDYLRKKIPERSLRVYLGELKPPAQDEEETESEEKPEDQIEDSSIENRQSSDSADIQYNIDTEQQTELVGSPQGAADNTVKQEPPIFTVEDKPTPIEDPKDLEIQFLKEQVSELQDALKQTEQFKPANKLTEEQAKNMTMEVVKQAGMATPIILTEEMVFEWLAKREDKITCFYYPNFGINLVRSRILEALENSGVKMFKRLYFEV